MTPSTSHPSGASATATTSPPTRRVVDAATRMLHWLMAFSFTGAYLTAENDHWRLVHITLGYTLAGLVLTRLVWGLAGPLHARLSGLVNRLRAMPQWLSGALRVRTLTELQTSGRSAQNLLMAGSIALFLALVLPLVLSGYGVWAEWGGEWSGELFEEIHEWFGNMALMAVLAHIGMLALVSLLRRKNQALPMLTGRIAGPGPDLAPRNHGLVAALILACVLAFWTWQWHTAPNVAPMQATHSSD